MPQSEAAKPTGNAPEPLSGTAPRLYERAAALLEGQIASGALAEGSYLTESMVAERFGISRPPARRALAELAGRGLLSQAKGKGYAVLAAGGETQAATAAGRPSDAAEESVRLLSSASWERIYGEIEDQIVARISFASWRINEARLARHYAVSRTVARDVVGRLQQRGILRKDERSRWYAPALTPDHIAELYELRAILEPVALLKAAARLPEGLLPRLRARLDAAMASPGIGGATLDALEEDLHVTLLGHCGNQALMQAITLPQSLLIAHRFLYRWTPRLFESEPFLPEHRDILEHLAEGDAGAAAQALRHHLDVSRERAVARVDLIRREFNAEDLPYLERLAAE
ncbi:GntR family transcriptional regulator [Aurantimonas sp. HBX-1]|uniref:GntR family transcriptional regulator n=1 Tax=Aurantimonas sp. HBX-1 TaxID=2906072 RepID=UPI001F44D7A3|nr:GntR family transcriptional regulator [Aurantimonas sp. HBX-1]UIJ72150.1 GntR family transcriptional regulator [Aurantimonas sp. HBX-1]